jgi:hypothetical protein
MGVAADLCCDMGISIFSRCGTGPANSVAPNPDPAHWRLLEQEVMGDLSIALVEYDGCTNFEGRKLLLLRGVLKLGEPLDPHFRPGGPVMARFEPTSDGWKVAQLVASAHHRGTEALHFEPEDQFNIAAGLIFVGKFIDGLARGRVVEIRGDKYVVLDIESFYVGQPLKPGDNVGIHVNKL